jgi:hypothetical protein
VSFQRERANRVAVDVLLNQQGRWIAGGASPSFPFTVLDSVIAGLLQLRDPGRR